MGDITNDFSWSWSRHRTFETCKRRYYLNHYGFWGGWAPDEVDAEVREIYIQKQLNTVAQWKGSLVHEAVYWVLREAVDGNFYEPAHVVERYVRLARRQIDESARGLYRANPKRHPGFEAHYYGVEVPGTEWEEAVDDVADLVRRMFDHPAFLRLAQVPARIREMEKLAQVRLSGVPVWVSLDVLVEDGDGGFVVIDWKTGRAHSSSEVEGQLAVYASYVLDAYLDCPPDQGGPRPTRKIKTMYANLRDGSMTVFDADNAAIERTISLIEESSAAMRALLVDVERNVAREEDFEPLPEGSEACVHCAFRRCCGRD